MADVQVTQLPIVVAYAYAIVRPYINTTAQAWLTPPPRCE